MKQTYTQFFTLFIIRYIKNILNYRLKDINIRLIYLLLGFFISTTLSTISAQTGDWGIIASAIIVSWSEIISKIIYKNLKKNKFILSNINYVKIGIIYGLFVDAFKLGS